MKEQLKGKYHITMVLPVWTVENDLTLLPGEEGRLDGVLDTLNGGEPVPFTSARWNKNYFSIQVSVGPGTLRLTGSVEGDALRGVVEIDDTPDALTGQRIE